MSSEFEVSAAEPSVAEFATQLPTVVVAGVPLGYIERRLSVRDSHSRRGPRPLAPLQR